MDTYIREQITNLRHTLHACPEISGQEKQTKETLQEFLKAHTSLELNDCGEGFYAAHREGAGNGIAFRADYDALALPEGGAAHLCGHDGHASALCGLALMLEGKTAGRDVFLLFQPAEETGAGAYPCTELFEKEQITGLYIWSGLYQNGYLCLWIRRYDIKILWKGSSCGLSGKWSVPGSCVGELLRQVPEILTPEHYTGMVLCTVIGVQMGEKAFGAAAQREWDSPCRA